jgi:hypothetical protein
LADVRRTPTFFRSLRYFPSAIATQHLPLPAYALSAGSLALSRQSQMSIAIFPSCAPDSRCEKAVQTRSSG